MYAYLVTETWPVFTASVLRHGPLFTLSVPVSATIGDPTAVHSSCAETRASVNIVGASIRYSCGTPIVYSSCAETRASVNIVCASIRYSCGTPIVYSSCAETQASVNIVGASARYSWGSDRCTDRRTLTLGLYVQCVC
jgi:hypothetical protein